MAKQTFTTGQVLTAAQMTSLQQTAMGGGSATAKTANYVLVAADAGTTVAMNAAGATTITVNTGLFAAGDIVTIQNRGAGTTTITAGTATVDTAGSLALAQHEGGILYFTATGAAVFYDYVQASGGSSSWTTWTPTFNGLTQGNGTLIARYIQVGKVVDFYINFTFGSTSSMTGAMNFTLPITPSQNKFTIYGIADDVGTVGYPIIAQVEGGVAYTGAILANATYTTKTNFSGSVPFSWGNTDLFNFTGSYEVA
jgi:hypothetical protein